MTTFVQVPAQAIEDFLKSKGFTRTVHRCEVVYVRAHEDCPDVVVKVYTSIGTRYNGTRGNGRDSIKVCTVFDDGRKRFGIGKFPRIHRTGSTEAVFGRMLERMRAAYARGSQWLREDRVRQDLLWKREFAKREREQEERAFLAGP